MGEKHKLAYSYYIHGGGRYLHPDMDDIATVTLVSSPDPLPAR